VWDGLAPLRTEFAGTRWMRPELFHLTLLFLGDVEATRQPTISEELAEVARRHVPYITRTNGAGGHVDDGPSRRSGGVAWLTLADGLSETSELATEIDAQLNFGLYNERRRPRPHLTVARAVDVPALAALRDLAPTLRLEWLTSSIVLFRSHLGPGGSHYEALSTHELPAVR